MVLWLCHGKEARLGGAAVPARPSPGRAGPDSEDGALGSGAAVGEEVVHDWPVGWMAGLRGRRATGGATGPWHQWV